MGIQKGVSSKHRKTIIGAEIYSPPQYTLVKIYRHLLAAEDGLNGLPQNQRDPYEQIHKAKEVLVEIMDAAPMRSERPRRAVTEHLGSACAIAEEHIDSGGREEGVTVAIRKAISRIRGGW